MAITIHPDHAAKLLTLIQGASWGDVSDYYPAEEIDAELIACWNADGEAFAEAKADAQTAIDAETGTIDGTALADALETMSGREMEYGDDPATRKMAKALLSALDWDMSTSDLIDELRAA